MLCKHYSWTSYRSWKYIVSMLYSQHVKFTFLKQKNILLNHNKTCFNVFATHKLNCRMDFRMKPLRDLYRSYIWMEMWWFLQEKFYIVNIRKSLTIFHNGFSSVIFTYSKINISPCSAQAVYVWMLMVSQSKQIISWNEVTEQQKKKIITRQFFCPGQSD